MSFSGWNPGPRYRIFFAGVPSSPGSSAFLVLLWVLPAPSAFSGVSAASGTRYCCPMTYCLPLASEVVQTLATLEQLDQRETLP